VKEGVLSDPPLLAVNLSLDTERETATACRNVDVIGSTGLEFAELLQQDETE
jgi:hypothetical protein